MAYQLYLDEDSTLIEQYSKSETDSSFVYETSIVLDSNETSIYFDLIDDIAGKRNDFDKRIYSYFRVEISKLNYSILYLKFIMNLVVGSDVGQQIIEMRKENRRIYTVSEGDG